MCGGVVLVKILDKIHQLVKHLDLIPDFVTGLQLPANVDLGRQW